MCREIGGWESTHTWSLKAYFLHKHKHVQAQSMAEGYTLYKNQSKKGDKHLWRGGGTGGSEKHILIKSYY